MGSIRLGGSWLTLRVVLGAALLTSGVQSDDLVADDIVACLEGRRDGEGGGVVVGYSFEC